MTFAPRHAPRRQWITSERIQPPFIFPTRPVALSSFPSPVFWLPSPLLGKIINS